jgi:hypothetical protein
MASPPQLIIAQAVQQIKKNIMQNFMYRCQNHHIVQKAIDFLQRFLRHGWFDDDIREGQFVLTILTLNDFKRRSIAYGLKKKLRQILGKPLAALHAPYPGNWPLPVEIVVIPQLVNLIPGKTASSFMRRSS